MPQLNNVGPSLSASGARTTINSPSWLKYGASFVDHEGNEIPIGKDENLLERFDELVTGWEKKGLLDKKYNGYKAKIKDTEARSGPPREWDHLVFSFSKEESATLSLNDKEAYRKALIEAFCVREDVPGKGHRMMLVADGHDDTGNYHIHVMLHRHPVDKDDKYIGIAVNLFNHSVAAHQAKVLNDVLLERDLLPISDWRNGTASIYEDRGGVSDEVKETVSAMIQEAGGEPSLDVLPGMTPEAGRQAVEERPKFTPEEKQIAEFIKIAEREAKHHAKQAQEAAQQVALGQHALKAIEESKRAEEERARAVAEKDAVVGERDTLAKDLSELMTTYEQTSAALKDVTEKQAQIGDFFKAAAEVLPKDVLAAPVTEQAKWVAGAVKDTARSFEPLAETMPPAVRQAPIVEKVSWLVREHGETVSALEVAAESNKRLRGDLDGLRAKTRDLQAQAEARSKELDLAQAEIRQRVAEGEKLSAAVEKAESDKAALRTDLKKAEQTSQAMRKQVEQATALVKKYEEITTQQRGILDTQAADLVRAQGIIGKYREEVVQLDTAVGERDKQIESLQGQLAELKNKLVELQAAKGPVVSDKDKELTEKLLAEEAAKKGKKHGPGPDGPKE